MAQRQRRSKWTNAATRPSCTARLVAAGITPALLLLAGCGPQAAQGTGNRSNAVISNTAASNNTVNTTPLASGTDSANSSLPDIQLVDMVSAQDGWATGQTGGQQALWRSTDQGLAWARIPLPFQVSAKGKQPLTTSEVGTQTLFAADATASGVDTYETANGGKSWVSGGTASTSDTMVSYFHFVNASDGWIATDNGVAAHQSVYHLFRSTDGGKTWRLVAETNASGSVGSVPGYGDATFSFGPSGGGWMTGQSEIAGHGFLMHSTDGGKTWQAIPVPVPKADGGRLVTTSTPTYVGSHVFVPVQYQGHNRDTTVVLQLNRNGDVISTTPALQTDHPLSITFINATDGWATTAPWAPNQPKLYRTTNGGQSWVSLPADQPMLATNPTMQFVSPDTGFAFASNQTTFPPSLWTTRNGGRTWRQQMMKIYAKGGPTPPGQNPPPPPPQFTPDEIDFVSSQVGYLAGTYGNGVKDTGRVYKTTDGGKQWTEIYHGGRAVTSLDARGSKLWVDVGQGAGSNPKGTLLVSNDGGQHFTRLAATALTSIDFVSTADGWAVSTSSMWNGKLVYTHDGGRTWTVQSLPKRTSSTGSSLGPAVGGSPQSVSFADSTHGMLLETGQPGAGQQPKALLQTNDGGKTWHWTLSVGMDSSGGSHGLGSGGYADGIDVTPGNPSRAYIWESRGPLAVTSDGGQTWSSVALTKPEVTEAAWVSMLSASDGYALVHDMSTGTSRFVVEKTTDGMKSWTAVHRWG